MSTQETMSGPVLGEPGELCAGCGVALASDQRYCLNCGWRRGEARVDYERRLNGGVQPNANGAMPAEVGRSRGPGPPAARDMPAPVTLPSLE